MGVVTSVAVCNGPFLETVDCFWFENHVPVSVSLLDAEISSPF